MKCVVTTCENRTDYRSFGVSFHKLPENEFLQIIWKNNIGMPQMHVTKSARICSEHFKNECLIKLGRRTMLSTDAIPTYAKENLCIIETTDELMDTRMDTAGPEVEPTLPAAKIRAYPSTACASKTSYAEEKNCTTSFEESIHVERQKLMRHMNGKEYVTTEKERQNEKLRRSTRRTKREVDLSVCPARVDHVRISGLDRTRDDYVQRVANSLFKAQTFQDVLLECNKARNYMNDLGIYKDIDIHIDISRGPDASPYGYDITFSGTEMSRILGAAGTEVGQNEGSLTIELATPNIWGRGERLSLQGSYSNSKTSDVQLKLSKPFLHTQWGDYRPEASISLFRHAMLVPVSAYRNSNVGILGDFSLIMPLLSDIVHSFQYEMSFREISTIGKKSPFFVREHCGPRMASLLRYLAAYDQRDSNVFPTRGFFIKLTNEYNGLGGNISYLMSNVHAEVSVPLFAGVTAQLTTRAGIVSKINKNNPVPPIGSLFTLGGPLTLRGFKFGGVGPHMDGYAMGAYSFWATGLHLWAPLPFSKYLGRFSNNFKTHAFYNFGNCNSFSTDNMRSAAGLGLAIRLAERARIEFNYCFPLLKQQGDQTEPGFQFGIGYEFL